jgi:transcription elongation GreA/GreB family factor
MSSGSGAFYEKRSITRYGYYSLLKELAHLRKVIRPAVLQELCEARAFGLKEDNHQYLVARERHLALEKRSMILKASSLPVKSSLAASSIKGRLPLAQRYSSGISIPKRTLSTNW